MVFRLASWVSFAVGTLAVAVLLPGVGLAEMQPVVDRALHGTVIATQTATPSAVEQLQLTDQQRRQIRTLRKSRNQEIARVLNESQRKKLVQALKSGTKLSAALQTLNLSADQQQKIKAIVQKSNQQMKAVLTAKQLQQLETMRKQHQTTAQTPIE